MSIYSGFATRQLESKYMFSLYTMNSLLSDRMLRIMSGEAIDPLQTAKWCRYFI